MSILLKGEALIPLRSIRDIWNEQLAPDAPLLWIKQGIRGNHLEAVKVGDTYLTSAPAVRRFEAALSLDEEKRRLA